MDKKKAIIFSPSNVPFAQGRTIGVYQDENEKIWFHGPDVARLLEYKLPGDMYRMLDDENKTMHIVHGLKTQSVSISEAGFYQIAASSRTELGKKLMRFVCEEVLPSIRRNGTYIAPTATAEQIRFAVENAIVDASKKLAQGKKLPRKDTLQDRCRQLMETKGYLEIKNDSVTYIREKLRNAPKGSQDHLFPSLRAAANEHIANKSTSGKMSLELNFGAQLLLLEIADNKADYLNRSRAKRLVDANKK